MQGRLKVERADGKIFLFECHHRKEPSGEYHRVRDNITGEFAPGSFCIILAAVRFDNMPTEEKAEALSGLRTLLAPGRCLLLVVSSIAIYVNEWASFSTRDFSEKSPRKRW